MTNQIVFHDPWWFLALLAVPAALWWRSIRPVTVFLIPFAASWHRSLEGSKSRLMVSLGVGGLVLLTVGLGRPQRLVSREEIKPHGYDLMLVLDLSRSMLAEDYERNGKQISRLEALQPVVNAFIAQRPNDRIGVVVFAGLAYTMTPLTFDHAWIARRFQQLKIGVIPDGTAIGDGIGVALSRLNQGSRWTDGKRRGAFIVLMTDGANNSGSLEPLEAAALARAQGVPIYTIATGNSTKVEIPAIDASGRKIYETVTAQFDEPTLWRIAMNTGGMFFRAGDANTIERTFAAIDSAKAIQFQTRHHVVVVELFPLFVLPALALLGLAAVGLAQPETLRIIAAQGNAAFAAALHACSPGVLVLRKQTRNFFV